MDFELWLADRVLSFYRNDIETDMETRWEEINWWSKYKEGVELASEFFEVIA